MPRRHTVTNEEVVSFLDDILKEEGPVDLSEHRVQEELRLCFLESTADCCNDHTNIVGMLIFGNIYICPKTELYFCF